MPRSGYNMLSRTPALVLATIIPDHSLAEFHYSLESQDMGFWIVAKRKPFFCYA